MHRLKINQVARWMVVLTLCVLIPVTGRAQAEQQPGSALHKNADIFGFSVTVPQDRDASGAPVHGLALQLSPGTRQTLELPIKNETDAPMTLKLEVQNAVTSNQGRIAYRVPDVSAGAAERVAFADIASVSASFLDIPPQSLAVAVLTIDSPDTLFEGEVLGGLSMTRLLPPQDNSPDALDFEGPCYVLRVSLAGKAGTHRAGFALDSIDAKALSPDKTRLVFKIKNTQPIPLSPLGYSIHVFSSDDSHIPIFESYSSCGSMAPRSTLCLTRDVAAQIPAGDYVGKVSVIYQNETHEMQQAFTLLN